MPELLHEYWEDGAGNGGQFGPVKVEGDAFRLRVEPDSCLVFSLHASSWHEAMGKYNDRLGYGAYRPAEGVIDHAYTDDEKATQDAYLRIRRLP